MKKLVILFITIIVFLIAIYFFVNKEDKNNDNNLTKIRVAEVTHSIFYAPQYVAIENGYFKDEGLDIELILTPGADNVMAAVLSGDVEIGFSGSESTIYVYNSGEKDYPKTFAQLTQKDGSFIVGREKINNFTLNDLKDKYIIGGRIGGMPEMTLEWSLKENGIDPKNDLTIDTSVAFASMASAFIGGTGDFVALFEPQATKMENEGYGYIVASLGELGGVVPYTAYNAKSSYIENNKDIIEKFTRATQKGLDYVHTHNAKEIAEVVLNQFPDTSLNDLEKAIQNYIDNDTWPKKTTFTEESFNHLQDIIVEAGQLDENKKTKYEDLVYIK